MTDTRSGVKQRSRTTHQFYSPGYFCLAAMTTGEDQRRGGGRDNTDRLLLLGSNTNGSQ